MDSADPIIAHFLKQRGRYAEVVRHGLPIVDGIYWDWPSPLIGGWFLMQLQDAKARFGNSVISLIPPARRVRPLASVIKELEREHRQDLWYRGQRRRLECVYEGHVPRMEGAAPGINPIRVNLEALIPSLFRAYTRARPATWQQFRLAPPLDYLSGPARAIFASRNRELGKLFLTVIDCMLLDAIRIGQAETVNIGYGYNLLAPGTTVAQATLDFISIAQHYEYESVMVDVSTSIDASAWFATHDWKTGAVAASGDGSPGVIYRFDATKINAALRNHINGPSAMAPPALQALGVFGLADIRARFAFLERPRAQAGGSLLGMENVFTHSLMLMHEAIEAFPFDHASVTGRETSYTQADICPQEDLGAKIFRPDDKYSSAPLTSAELSTFLSWMEMDPGPARHIVSMREAGVI